MFSYLRSLLALIVMTVCAVGSAEPPAGAPPAVQLLNTGWKASAGNYKSAQELYGQARQDAPNDVRILYAMALVAAQNHHLPEASTYLNEGLSKGKPLLPIRRTRNWLDVRLNDKAAAKDDIRELARILSADEVSANRADYRQSARWLGAVIGYYAGPGKNQLTAADLAALDTELSSTLKDPLTAQYAEGKAAVDKQFRELQNQLTAALAQTKAANEVERIKDRDKNNATLADEINRRTRAEQELSQYRQEKNADAVEYEFDQVNRQLKLLKAHYDQLVRWRELRDADDKNADKSRDNSAENEMRSAISAVQGRLGEVRRTVQEIRERSQDFISEADRARKSAIQLTDRKRQLDHPASAYDNATRALEAKVKSINTYAGIDLEEERRGSSTPTGRSDVVTTQVLGNTARTPRSRSSLS
jgi:hypothetical protein